MDNKTYEIHRDYADGLTILYLLSEQDRKKVEDAITVLSQDPWPKQYGAKPLGGEAVKITVAVEDDEITVQYAVDVYRSTVDLMTIKRRGRFQRAAEWLAELAKFEPKGQP